MTDTTKERASLEQALTDKGFVRVPGMGYLAWQGMVGERRYTVSVAPIARTTYPMEFRRRVTVGHRLGVELVTTVRIQLFFMSARAADRLVLRSLHRLKGFSTLHPASVPAGYCVVTNDARWADRLCQQAHAMAAVTSLMDEGESPENRGSVYFRADSSTGLACFGSPTSTDDVESGQLDRIFAQLAALADAAEGLPAPTAHVTLGRWGRLTEGNPLLGVFLLFMGAVVLLGLGALMIVALVVLIAWLIP